MTSVRVDPKEPEWHSPDWSLLVGWQAHVPRYVQEIWPHILPTHKVRLMKWAEAIEEAEQARELEAMETYPKDDD